MRIAFVGKGGAGKTTLSALFALHIADKGLPVLAVDADINMHMGELLGMPNIPDEGKHISHPGAVKEILKYLRGANKRIGELSHFRKTTPPAEGSNLISILSEEDLIMRSFAKRKGLMSLMVVGTYDTDDIGASCYHNNLAIFENVLSHLLDEEGVVVADMVAGVDAFANTLHAQFDLLVLAVEPTKRGIEVFDQYCALAREAGVYENLVVVGNKIRTESDRLFVQKHIPPEKLIGFLGESAYLRRKEQSGGALEISSLESGNTHILESIFQKLETLRKSNQERLPALWNLHRKYVAQAFIKERFGDLTTQIDERFKYEDYSKNPHA